MPTPHERLEIRRQMVRGQLQKLARYLKTKTPKGWGFALLMFEFSDKLGGNLQWVSSAQRADMIKSLRECADRLEQGRAGELNLNPRDN